MKYPLKAILYGLGVWLVPFAVAFLAFPLRDGDRALFESVMAVAVALSAAFFAALYHRQIAADHVREGLLIGIVWLIMNIAIDLLFFTWGPMAMAFADYLKDIGVTYLIYPAVATLMGWATARRNE